jgi:hypothetical protein
VVEICELPSLGCLGWLSAGDVWRWGGGPDDAQCEARVAGVHAGPVHGHLEDDGVGVRCGLRHGTDVKYAVASLQEPCDRPA